MNKINILILMFITSMLNAQISEVKIEGSYAKIYNDVGRYTGNSIYLGNDFSIRNVSCDVILIKEGSYIKYYNFQGRYTGNSTYDSK